MEILTLMLLVAILIFGLITLIWTYFIAFSQGGCLSLGLTFIFPGIAQMYYFVVMWQRQGFGIYQIMNIIQLLLCLMLFIIMPLFINPGQDILSSYRQKNYNESVSSLNNIYKTSFPTNKINTNSKDPKTYYNKAINEVSTNDYNSALADCNKAILLKANYAEAYQLRGYIKANMKDYKGAIQEYNKAIKLKPSFSETYKLRGSAKAELKDYKGAINDYSLAIKLKPSYAASYFLRAIAKGNLKDRPGEIKDLEKAKELYKKQPDMNQYNIVDEYLKGIKSAKN